MYRIDEVVTAQGKLVSEEGGMDVMSPVTGKIKKVYAENGKRVSKGDLIVEFDIENNTLKLDTLRQQQVISKQRFKEKLDANSKNQKSSKRNIILLNGIVESYETLKDVGAVAKLQYLTQKNRLAEETDRLDRMILARQEIITEHNAQTKRLEGSIKEIELAIKNKYLYAPISGTVFDNKINSTNYISQTAESLMKIIPEGALAGKVNVSNKDIGFIKTGQEVKVRVDTFPFTEYGEIEGAIQTIGADALPPNNEMNTYHFPVNIDLDRSTLITRENLVIPLQAGMTITTNIKLRDRRIIELLGDLFTDRSESIKRLRNN